MSIRTCQDQVKLTLVGIKQELGLPSSVTHKMRTNPQAAKIQHDGNADQGLQNAGDQPDDLGRLFNVSPSAPVLDAL